MLVHRRQLHKHKRFNGINITDLLSIEQDKRIDDIEKIIDHNSISKEYKAQFKNGDVDWITILNDGNTKVRKYFETVSTNVEFFEVANGDWMVPQWENE